jgi:predicted permease
MSKAKLSFFVAFLYVSIGTVYGLYFFDSWNAAEGIDLLLYYFFVPVSLIPAIISQGDSTHHGLIAFFQIFSFLVIWLFLWAVMWIGANIFGKQSRPTRLGKSSK